MTAKEHGVKGASVERRDQGLLDYDGAARYLCTTPRHVRELWARRHLAAIKVGRSVRFSQADLDLFIEAHRVKAVR
jgi:excisionase family DNA binding protein